MTVMRALATIMAPMLLQGLHPGPLTGRPTLGLVWLSWPEVPGTPHPKQVHHLYHPKMTWAQAIKGCTPGPLTTTRMARAQPGVDNWHQLPLLIHGRGTACSVKWRGQRPWRFRCKNQPGGDTLCGKHNRSCTSNFRKCKDYRRKLIWLMLMATVPRSGWEDRWTSPNMTQFSKSWLILHSGSIEDCMLDLRTLSIIGLWVRLELLRPHGSCCLVKMKQNKKKLVKLIVFRSPKKFSKSMVRPHQRRLQGPFALSTQMLMDSAIDWAEMRKWRGLGRFMMA